MPISGQHWPPRSSTLDTASRSRVKTVRRLQIDAGLWIPRKLRPPKVQQPRARRASRGELIQIDGCEHRRFEDRVPACTALMSVDDATSHLMVVRFTGAESTFGYFEARREYIKRYGKPPAKGHVECAPLMLMELLI